jgi:hypothetical protein
MRRCSRCRADVPLGRKTCPGCGLRAGVLPSNEADPRLRRRRVAPGQVAGRLRLAVVLVVASGLAVLLLQHPDVLDGGLRSVLDGAARTGTLLLQAAAQQVAARSRTPAAAGGVDVGRLVVLAVFVGGLYWLARTRLR